LRKVLETLMELQKTDSLLSQLESLKGDLPLQVERLRKDLSDAEKNLETQEKGLENNKRESGAMEIEIASLDAKLKTYQNQLFEVKTNREYDAVTHEIDSVKSDISKKENRQIELMEASEALTKSIGAAKETLERLKVEFEKKQADLGKKQEATEREELALKDKRMKLLRGIDAKTLSGYERIRKAKNGLALVPVVHNACGGCHKTLPPQKVLEIRDMDRMYVCETCGRIIVWDEVVSEQTA
jgi:uncharacterized protein